MKSRPSYEFSRQMNRILRILFFSSLLMLARENPVSAQKDSTRKNSEAGSRAADSVKNILLNKQSDDFQSIRMEQLKDSLRLLELKKEILQLGAVNSTRKQALSQERDQLQNRDSLRTALQKIKIDSLRSTVSGFPVYLSQDTLFYIYTKLGSFSPKERAGADISRIHKLAEDYFFSADSLSILSTEYTTDVTYHDEILVSISDLDALWMNSTRSKLADTYRLIIAKSVSQYKTEHSWKTILKELLLALLVLTLLILIIFFTNRFFKWVKNKIEKQRGSAIKGLKIRNYEFLDSGREIKVLFSFINIVKWIVTLILVYISLTIMVGIFPWTSGFAGELLSYFLDPVKRILVAIWNYLPNLITIIVLVVFFRYLLRIFFYFKTEIERGALKIPGFYVDWANPTFQIIRVLILAFMLIVIFPYLPGSDSQIFKGVSVFLGVLFTFGSAGALSNIVAGLVLTYMRAYRIGDRVKIGEATGDVVEKSLLVTRIKTIKNEIISIPNSTVMSSHTTNFTAEAAELGLILHTTVTIGYDAPWRQIHELLIKAALATELIEKDPAPFVFQSSLDDFYVSYQINAYTRISNKQHITYSLLHQNIQDEFNKAGVEIMSSHYSNIRDGNKTTVPDDHLPEDYVTPSFRVKQTGKD
jgi:small-conductance mechanosensitive channel